MIEEINLRGRAIHVQVDEIFGLGRKVRQAGHRGVHLGGGGGLGHGALAEELREGDAAHL